MVTDAGKARARDMVRTMLAGPYSDTEVLSALRVAQSLLRPHSAVAAVLRAAVAWHRWHRCLTSKPGWTLPKPEAELLASVRALLREQPELGEVQS